VKGYLKRMQAISAHVDAIKDEFRANSASRFTWAANKNEANLRLEFGLKGIGVAPVESKHEIGIQRVASWLHTNQLFFAYTAKEVLEQTKGYRYAENTNPSTGEKKAKEAVFKLKDEYPDAVRYAIMAWPHLPDAVGPTMTATEQKRWDALSDNTKLDIQRIRDYNKRSVEGEMQPADEGYPVGEFFNSYDNPWEG